MNHFEFRIPCCEWRRQSPGLRLLPATSHPGRRVLLLTLLLSSVLSFLPSAFFVSNAYAADVQYVYDDLGRLSAVIDSTTSEAALYQYDAVGNLLGIVRQPASTIALLNFTPKSGPVGTSVTIAGIGFSPTASQNIVRFNGMAATLSSATATQLVVMVPTGATTGPIAVTTPSGSATSSTPFTVTSSATGLPAVTSFTPIVGASGTAVTISGSNFVTPALENRIVFHTAQAVTTTATPTSLTTSVPAAATSGPITVVTPAGQGVSPTDFFVPPAPYTAAAVAVATRLTFGQAQAVTLTTANTIALLIITASAGHRLGLNMTNVTFSSSTLSIADPYGQVVASTTVTTAGGFLDTPLLTTSGTYTVLVDPDGTATGSLTLTPHDIVDITGSITPGTATTLPLATPGQNALLTFPATAGQRVSVHVTTSTLGTCTSGRFAFREPDGTPWVKVTNNIYTTIDGTPCTNTFMEPEPLVQSGTHTFLVDPAAASTGQLTFTLYVFSDLTAPLTLNTATATTISIPGQQARLTFTNTAGQRVLIHVNSSALPGNCNAHAVVLQKPDASWTSISACPGFILETTTIATAGISTVVLDPGGASTGQLTITVYDVPPDLTGTITPGAATSVTLAASGQGGSLTFSALAGQRASVRLTNSTISAGFVSLRKPDGTTLVSATLSSGFLNAVTLPVTGTYTVVVDPSGISTGQMTLTLYVFSDLTDALTINGASVTVTLTIPGQREFLTFSGTASQLVTVRLTGNTMGFVDILLNKLDGTAWVGTGSSASSFTMPQQTVPVTGTYTIVVDPGSFNVGSIVVNATSP